MGFGVQCVSRSPSYSLWWTCHQKRFQNVVTKEQKPKKSQNPRCFCSHFWQEGGRDPKKHNTYKLSNYVPGVFRRYARCISMDVLEPGRMIKRYWYLEAVTKIWKIPNTQWMCFSFSCCCIQTLQIQPKGIKSWIRQTGLRSNSFRGKSCLVWQRRSSRDIMNDINELVVWDPFQKKNQLSHFPK